LGITPEDAAKAKAGVNPLDQRPDAHLLNGPAREGEGVAQDDVDRLLKAVESGEVPAVPQSQGDTDAPTVPPAPAPEAVPDAPVASQDDIDQLFK